MILELGMYGYWYAWPLESGELTRIYVEEQLYQIDRDGCRYKERRR